MGSDFFRVSLLPVPVDDGGDEGLITVDGQTFFTFFGGVSVFVGDVNTW